MSGSEVRETPCGAPLLLLAEGKHSSQRTPREAEELSARERLQGTPACGPSALLSGRGRPPSSLPRVSRRGAAWVLAGWLALLCTPSLFAAGGPLPVLAVAFRPSGAAPGPILVAAGVGPSVRLWDAQTGALVREFPGHREAVHSLAFSRDGRLLAAGGYQEVRLWEAETGRLVRVLSGHAHRVVAVAFSPDDKILAAAGGAP
ncbi:MAG: hypothetical protein FJX77_12720, partial [Armatimonadetes bacterium]|nr:hypothetical protein [Armatimonadota bacterium]